ncbi:MAG: amidohydrolase family protein [Gemmatimonadota bacterium]|nr:amidohydrolase family protein [Gemmatimonadota bacterium]
MTRNTVSLFVAALIIAGSSSPVAGQVAPKSGVRATRLVIRNAMVVSGNGTPAAGPYDVVIEDHRIAQIVSLDPIALRTGANRPTGDAEIDATGKYVLPGIINAHAHLQDERGGIPQPYEYELKLWLSCGITTVREVGADDTRKVLAMRERSRTGEVAAPRIYVYGRLSNPPAPQSSAETRQRVRDLKAMGVDGIKIIDVDREVLEAAEDEAHKLNLRIAHHVGVQDANAWDDIRLGTTSIEHWYGIPDAAFADGVQHFPSNYNYRNEVDRFRYAGRIWREADTARLTKVLEGMIAAHVAWVPTLDIYEASRDLQRAQTQPWFKDYLHPTLEEYFRPNPANHGSYFIGWTSTDEAFWKENYRIWMAALREFERKGGLIGVGDDAGFIYQMYGFGTIREMELQQEAGFSTIKVIQHATQNNAKILGVENELGRVKRGYLADLIVVNGNPLEDLKVLYPTGVDQISNGAVVHSGGIEWTIKDGIPYHVPELMSDVKAIVAAARAAKR